jgi:hypothetical protein
MRRIFSLVAAALLAIPMRPAPGTGPPTPAAGSAEVTPDEPWYAPDPADFRPIYDRDAANRGKQTWDQYWTWVQSFYRGNYFALGWTGQAQRLERVVKSRPEQRRLRAQLNALGRDICGEWAKDYNIRRVNSADLLGWGRMLEKAKGRDDGRGVELGRAIDSIREEYRRKLNRP